MRRSVLFGKGFLVLFALLAVLAQAHTASGAGRRGSKERKGTRQQRGSGNDEPPTEPKRCYYEVLGVKRTASAKEIKSSYRRLALEHHPDKAAARGDDRDAAHLRFVELNEAMQVLGDVGKRKMYDTHGHAAFDPSAGGFGDGFPGGGFGGPGGGFGDPFDVFESFFGGGGFGDGFGHGFQGFGDDLGDGDGPRIRVSFGGGGGGDDGGFPHGMFEDMFGGGGGGGPFGHHGVGQDGDGFEEHPFFHGAGMRGFGLRRGHGDDADAGAGLMFMDEDDMVGGFGGGFGGGGGGCVTTTSCINGKCTTTKRCG